MNKKLFVSVMIAAFLIAMIGGSMFASVQRSPGALPLAAPTPNTAIDRGNASPMLVTWLDAAALTADQTSTCYEVTYWGIADIYYNIDQTNVNTVTLTLKFGNSASSLVSGLNVVASNTADTSDLQSFDMFGRFACIGVDVANTNTVTITVNGLLK